MKTMLCIVYGFSIPRPTLLIINEAIISCNHKDQIDFSDKFCKICGKVVVREDLDSIPFIWGNTKLTGTFCDVVYNETYELAFIGKVILKGKFIKGMSKFEPLKKKELNKLHKELKRLHPEYKEEACGYYLIRTIIPDKELKEF